MATLVPSESEADDLERLRARVTQAEATLTERVAETEALKKDLERFRIRYRQDVGLLHEELDAIELAIAELELGELSKKLADAGAEGGASDAENADATAGTSPPARFTSDAVRKLFRDVAKAIHPDLADDEQARDRRHALMIEANRAYALGDEEHLRWILQVWERSPEAVQGTDPEAMRLRLERRLEQLEDQAARLDREIAELHATPLWELKVMVDQAAAKGKDLVADMVKRLKRDIMVATNRLDALRPPG